MKKRISLLIILVLVLSVLIFFPAERLNAELIKGLSDISGDDWECTCPAKKSWDCKCNISE